MRLVQLTDEKAERRVARVVDDGAMLEVLQGHASVYDLAIEAIRRGYGLADLVRGCPVDARLDYDSVELAGALSAPIDHPDPARLLVSGTGITHLGSAAARDAMHSGNAESAIAAAPSDSMKMFRWGLERGKPRAGEVGVQPEWFYKGDGSCVVRPGAPLTMPSFALSGGEEAEIVGIYIVDKRGRPWRIGFALGNEFSDHLVEEQNYLYAAHAKLRECSMGPELLVGELPASVNGRSRVIRDGQTLWEGEFASGEDNMSHSIANLEHHHFKYPMFRRPDVVHCHFFGAAVLSFAAGVRPEPGDVFELDVAPFGRPLRNPLRRADAEPVTVTPL